MHSLASFNERVARVAAVAALHADAVDEAGRFPVEAMTAMREERLLGAWLPVELGGLGATLQQITDACEAFGERCASAGMVFAMHQIQVASLMRHTSESPYLTEVPAQRSR